MTEDEACIWNAAINAAAGVLIENLSWERHSTLAAINRLKKNAALSKEGAGADISPAPDGYSKLPQGAMCKCFRMWRDKNGDHWCCLPTPSNEGAGS